MMSYIQLLIIVVYCCLHTVYAFVGSQCIARDSVTQRIIAGNTLFATPIEITDDDDDDDADTNTSTASSEENNTAPPIPLTNEEQLIQSWLQTHIPTLPTQDIQSYTLYLYNDGFRTVEQLNAINSGQSGRVEDLYFMKKGHRRVLMKKIGIMKSMVGMGTSPGNNFVRYKDKLDEQQQEGNSSNGANTRNNEKKQQKPYELDESISSWLEEQNKMVEERRVTRLADEKALNEKMNADEEEEKGLLLTEEEADPLSDFEVMYQTLERLPVDDHGTADKEKRRLDELKRKFLASRGSVSDFFEKSDQYSDTGSRSSDRYSDTSSLPRSTSPSTATSIDEPPDFVLDDLAARYSQLQDLDALDQNTKDKQERRLEEIKETFRSRAKRRKKIREGSVDQPHYQDGFSDDLSKRYESLDIEAMDEGSRNKEARRLDGLKSEYLKKKSAYSIEDEEPIRLDLLQRENREESATDRKERMRMQQFEQLAEKRRKHQRRQQSLVDEQEVMSVSDNFSSGGAQREATSQYKTSYKTNSERRVEDTMRYLKKRSKARAVKEDRLQALQNDVKKLKDKLHGTDSGNNEDDKVELDSGFFDERPQAVSKGGAGARSLSTTMPPQGEGKAFGDKEEPYCQIEDEECWDITKETTFDKSRKSSSLSTTLPPSNKGAQSVRRQPSNEMEECEIDDEECFDITQETMFSKSRQSQSLSTTLPPTNTKPHIPNPIVTFKDDGEYAYDVAKDSFPDSRGRTFPSRATGWRDQKRTVPKESVEKRRIQTEGLTAEEAKMIRDARLAAKRLEEDVSPKRDKIKKERNKSSTKQRNRLTDDDEEEGNINICAQGFSTDRSALLGHLPRVSIMDSGSTNPFSSKSSSPRTQDLLKKVEFLDNPRAFRSNVDMVSSNASGARFNGSRDVEKRNQGYDTWPMSDIDRMAMTKLSRVAEAPFSSSSDVSTKNAGELSGEEEVMDWLLTYLPDLKEEDAVLYFDWLLADGFDNAENLREIQDESDISFMKKGHQRVLLQCLESERRGEEEVKP